MSSVDETKRPENPLEAAGFEPRAGESNRNPVVRYFRDLKNLLTAPTLFFRNLERPVPVSRPLLFGVITSWIGTALEYLWYTGFGKFFESRISDVMRAMEKTAEIDSSGNTQTMLAMREKFMTWVFGVGSVLIDPFKTCAKILFLSFFVWIAARIFGNLTARDEAESGGENFSVGDRFRYESAVAVVGFATAASIFKGIPIVGGMIAGIFAVVLAVIGAQETYRVGTGRALLIALFPSLLFWGLILASLFAFLGGILFLFLR